MAAYTVYIDQVFLGNLVINYAILWGAAKLSRIPARPGRIFAGAGLGALYSLALFFPGKNLLFSVWFKIASSVIITAVAFVPLPPGKFLACLGCFYLTSFALGGLIFGMIFFIQSGRAASYPGIEKAVSEYFWPGLVAGLAAFWAAGKGIAAMIKRGVFENLFKMSLCIKSGGGQVNVEAFLDTGNRLKDPLTGSPVIVVEYGVIKPLLPAEVKAFFEGGGEPDVWQVLSSLGESRLASRFSAVPFRSLGRVDGLLVGFRPDEVIIERGGRGDKIVKAVVAVYHKKIDPSGSCQALLNPDLLELTG
ncbi:MAG TPA: sigma-E processing peptidase SpoIIGA [Bacillota bacterium]|nr:sigma-E processing peptidase SpoIIGA [Bacillota bacterium]